MKAPKEARTAAKSKPPAAPAKPKLISIRLPRNYERTPDGYIIR